MYVCMYVCMYIHSDIHTCIYVYIYISGTGGEVDSAASRRVSLEHAAQVGSPEFVHARAGSAGINVSAYYCGQVTGARAHTLVA